MARRRPVADPRPDRRDPGRLRARPAVQVADRRRPVAAPHLGYRRGRSSTPPSAAARRSVPDPGRPGRLHVPGVARRLRPRRAARPRPRHPVRPFAACRAGPRARTSSRRRRCRSWPSRRSSSSRSRPTGCRSLARRGLPDVLPGHDRVAARPARGRSAGPGAVPLVCGVTRRDPVEAPAADIGAVPLLRRSGWPPRPPSSARSSGRYPAGVADGLGSAIVNYNQYYVSAPGAAVGDDHHVHVRRLRVRRHRVTSPRTS